MQFSLDEGQLDLQATVARFAAQEFPIDAVGGREGQSVDRRLWDRMAELGLFGLLMAEDAGGSGVGPVEAAIVFEQLGAHLVPGPALWTVLAAGLVDGVASGEAMVGGVDAVDVQHGTALVEHAGALDLVLVLHRDRVVAHRTADLGGPQPLEPLDPLTPVGLFDGLDAPGTVVGGADEAAHLRLLGTVLTSATLVGIATRAVEVTRDYALGREQFGAPIGSFQAVKHLLADMYVRSSIAQSEVYAASSLLGETADDDPARAAARAKLLASDAALFCARTAIQVHGAMGFTWEMLPNYLLKRTWLLETTFRTGDDHALDLGTALVTTAS